MTTHPTDQVPTDQAPVEADGDLLDRLGFTPGDSEDPPLLVWARRTGWPTGWPGVRRAPRGQHRALRPATA